MADYHILSNINQNYLFYRLGSIGVNQENLTLDNLSLDGVPTKEQLALMCEKPKLVHFADGFKPWSLTGQVTTEQRNIYKDFLPFMTQWLQIYARLANFLKGFKL